MSLFLHDPAELSWRDDSQLPGDGQRLVLVLVDRFDLRAVRALEYAWQIPSHERRALHVAVNEVDLERLADDWMAHRPGVPLHVIENDGGVAATVRTAVELEMGSGYDEVVVVIGRVAFRHWPQRLLHDRTSNAIARALSRCPSTFTAVMTVASF